MFSAPILRRLRLCAASQPLSYVHLVSARHAAFPVSCRGITGTRLRPVTRSFLILNNKILRQSSRFLSTSTQSEDGNLIYTGSLGTTVRRVKLFSYSTSLASLILMPQIFLKSGLGVESFALKAAFCGTMGFFIFLTPVFLHIFTKGYVVRLYHNPDTDTYTAITYSVFITEKKNVFHQSQVRVPDISKMFTTFYANNRGLLVNPDLFSIPNDYNHLMGYDKPFSFDSDDMDRPEKF